MKMKLSKRIAFLIFALLACVVIAFALNLMVESNKPSFTVGRDTTRITEPLDTEGYVDYPTALNNQLREGVTPDNNANVLLLLAFGPRPEGAPLAPEFYEALGIAPPPETGNYFVKLSDYVQKQLKLDHEDSNRIDNQFAEARIRPWNASTYPEIAEWILANEKPLALVIEASKRPKYYNPLLPTFDKSGRSTLTSCLLPTVQHCRGVATALTARAMLRLQAGQTDVAWEDLYAAHQLARHIGNGGTLIEALVAFAVEGVVASADIAFLQHAQVDGPRLNAFRRDLGALRPMRPMSERFDAGERLMALDVMTMIDRRGAIALQEVLGRTTSEPELMERFLYSNATWEPALRNANQWFDQMVAAAETTDALERQRKLAELETELAQLKSETMNPSKFTVMRALVSRSAKGEHLGNMLIGTLLPAVCKVQGAADRHEQTIRNLRVAFALAAYRNDYARYPANIEELTPMYLYNLPQDLFSGRPLVYRPAPDGFLLYSVGPNGRDDKGSGVNDDPRGDDLPVRLPIPERSKQ